MDCFKRARANLLQNILMAIIMEVRGAAVHAFKLISGNIQVIYITWSVPDLYLQPLPDRNPRVTWQDLNPSFEVYCITRHNMWHNSFWRMKTRRCLLHSYNVFFSRDSINQSMPIPLHTAINIPTHTSNISLIHTTPSHHSSYLLVVKLRE